MKEFLTRIANAIRKRKGTTEKINAQDFEREILNIASQEIVVGGTSDEVIAEKLRGDY